MLRGQFRGFSERKLPFRISMGTGAPSKLPRHDPFVVSSAMSGTQVRRLSPPTAVPGEPFARPRVSRSGVRPFHGRLS
jgi:hypothetical protein